MESWRNLLRATALPWHEAPLGFSSAGMTRWGAVLDLRLPVLEELHFRFDYANHTWRVQLLELGLESGALIQARVKKDELAPWRWVPRAALEGKAWEPGRSLPLFLDLLAGQFQALPDPLQGRAAPHDRLSGTLTSASWALLSGRASAAQLWRPGDGNV